MYSLKIKIEMDHCSLAFNLQHEKCKIREMDSRETVYLKLYEAKTVDPD